MITIEKIPTPTPQQIFKAIYGNIRSICLMAEWEKEHKTIDFRNNLFHYQISELLDIAAHTYPLTDYPATFSKQLTRYMLAYRHARLGSPNAPTP